MDAVITRIIEIEKQSAGEIERAEYTCRKNIEGHRRTLEQEREREHTQIISAENDKLKQYLQGLNTQIEESSLAAAKEFENRFHDPALIEAIKGKIVAILLR